MILNIRGTHGSGKSTIVRTLLDKHPITRWVSASVPAARQGR